MATANVNPTRMELTRLKKRLVTARRGHKLLKDKRDELMRQFLDVVKLNKQLRTRVEEGLTAAFASFDRSFIDLATATSVPCSSRNVIYDEGYVTGNSRRGSICPSTVPFARRSVTSVFSSEVMTSLSER